MTQSRENGEKCYFEAKKAYFWAKNPPLWPKTAKKKFSPKKEHRHPLTTIIVYLHAEYQKILMNKFWENCK